MYKRSEMYEIAPYTRKQARYEFNHDGFDDAAEMTRNNYVTLVGDNGHMSKMCRCEESMADY